MDNLYYFYAVLGIIILGAAILARYGKVAEDEERKNKKSATTTHSIKKDK